MADEHEHHDEGHGGGGHGGGHGGVHGAHGGGHAEGEHEGAPEWLISFADNVALMMGFFVVLLALNMRPATGGEGNDPNKSGHKEEGSAMLDWVLAIRESFNNPVDPNSADPREAALVQRLMTRGRGGSLSDIGVPGDDHEVRHIRVGEQYAQGAGVTFAFDAIAVSESAAADLRALANRLRGIQARLEIHGHASAAEAFERRDRAMTLSYDRAKAVAEFLVAEGLDWRTIRIITHADADRVMPDAKAPLEHERNQRVEIIVSDDGAAAQE